MRALLILLGVLAVGLSYQEAHAQLPACGEAAGAACNGFCTTPGEACSDIGGGCGCIPTGGGVACGVGAGPPLCGGECPPFEACLSVVGVCECRASLPPCGEAAGAACNGFCTAPGDACSDIGGGCGCIPTGGGVACGVGAGPPLCGGECPSFEACLSVAGDCECRAAAICGNGVLEPSEECDDGNNDDGDGCSANCELEAPAVPTMPLQALVVFAALLLISAFVALLARRNGAQRAPNGR